MTFATRTAFTRNKCSAVTILAGVFAIAEWAEFEIKAPYLALPANAAVDIFIPLALEACQTEYSLFCPN